MTAVLGMQIQSGGWREEHSDCFLLLRVCGGPPGDSGRRRQKPWETVKKPSKRRSGPAKQQPKASNMLAGLSLRKTGHIFAPAVWDFIEPEMKQPPSRGASRQDWENYGRTPAVNVKVNTNYAFLIAEGNIPDDYLYADVDNTTESGYYPPIGAGGHTFGYIRTFSAEFLQLQYIRKGRMFVFGWIEYSDSFGTSERYRTEFCFEVELVANSWIDGMRDTGDIVGVRATGKFNGMDGGCFHTPKTQ